MKQQPAQAWHHTQEEREKKDSWGHSSTEREEGREGRKERERYRWWTWQGGEEAAKPAAGEAVLYSCSC
jgi:hypothetical protein